MADMVYTIEDGEVLIKYLRANGIKCERIGTLPSNHDIDVWVDEHSIKGMPIATLQTLLQCKKIIYTDMDSIFCLSRTFGHVDIFFEKPPKKSKTKGKPAFQRLG